MSNKEINFENKILDSIYKLESKRTKFWLLKYFILTIGSLFALIFVAVTLINVLQNQNTLDVLQIFGEDSDTLTQYWQDALQTIFEETPKDLLIGAIVFAVLLIIIAVILIKNYKKIFNKLRIIKGYNRAK